MLFQSLTSRNKELDEVKKMGDTRQLGIHLQRPLRGLGKALRVTSNSQAVIEALLKRNAKEDVEESVRKGCEVEVVKKSENPKEIFNLQSSEDLHLDPKCYFVDDTTGQVLDSKATKEARKLEMKTFDEMKVYEYVRKEIALKDKDGKLVGVRWVDVQKGPLVRSRLVAQEFAGNEEREDVFAATPPLFATKMVISNAASRNEKGNGERTLMVLDVKRAFLYGDIEDSIYIHLPPEDPYYGQGYVGKLVKAMYGTRGAPHVW